MTPPAWPAECPTDGRVDRGRPRQRWGAVQEASPSTCGTAPVRAVTRCTPRASRTRTSCAACRLRMPTGSPSPASSQPATKRGPHIHFEVYPDRDSITDVANVIATSQVALTKNVCPAVYVEEGYEASVTNLANVCLSFEGSSATTGARANSPPSPVTIRSRIHHRPVGPALNITTAPGGGTITRGWPWRRDPVARRAVGARRNRAAAMSSGTANGRYPHERLDRHRVRVPRRRDEAPGGSRHIRPPAGRCVHGAEQIEYKFQEMLDAKVHLIWRVTYESFAGAWPTSRARSPTA